MRKLRVIAALSLILASVGCSAGGGEPTSSSAPPPPHPEPSPAAPAPVPGHKPQAVEFRNVRIFDGHSDKLSAPSNVRVVGNRIEKISTEALPAEPGVTVIDGGGRTLMPGLIDTHWHTMLVRPTPTQADRLGDVGYLNLVAGAEATDTLMRGFTTVRDLGGPAFGLKRAIDEGIVAGPRIYPVRRDDHRHQRPRRLPPAVRSCRAPSAARCRARRRSAAAMIADSPDEVRDARARAADAGRVADQADGRRWRGVAAQPARRRPPSPRPSCAPPSKPPRTGAPTSPCTPTRLSRSSGRSPPA